MNEVTRILSALEQGDAQAADQLLPLVYAELRRLAARKLAQEKPGQTLDATALVHEAYVRLVGNEEVASGRAWQNRRHFITAAAEAMRRILIDNARRKRAVKHGGGRQRVPLDDQLPAPAGCADLLAIDDALSRLAERQPATAELVKLRFFVGLSTPEAAVALGISVATAERWWVYARTWLYAELADAPAERRSE